MILYLEHLKLKRTGYFWTILAGSLAAAAFPAINMLARAETFTAQQGNGILILLDANWQMMAMLNLLVIVCGTCIMYHTEYSNNGQQKMSVLPIHGFSLFLGKFVIALSSLAFMILIEILALWGCALYWFDSYTTNIPLLVQNIAFAWLCTIPAVMIMLVIASQCKNMWVSLGIGVILVFTFTIFPRGNLVLDLLPFSTPYAMLHEILKNEQLFIYCFSCIAWTVGFGMAEAVIQRLRCHPPRFNKKMAARKSVFSKRSVPKETAPATGQEPFSKSRFSKEASSLSFAGLVGIEFMKIRRSKIFLILLAPVVLMWVPGILNSGTYFKPQDMSITPENNFFIQGFMGMVWFMIPATLVIITVLLTQTERFGRGILKMLALPVSPIQLCLAKFTVLLALSLIQMLMILAGYFISAAIVSGIHNYNMILDPIFVLKWGIEIFISAIPMAAVFWLIAVLIKTPIFAVGVGLASIVPAVLILNTRIWFVYPMCYPFYLLMVEYGKAVSGMFATSVQWLPWIPVAMAITAAALAITCVRFAPSQTDL